MNRANIAIAIATIATLSAQPSPKLPAETLLDRTVLRALDEELSGVAAKDHVSQGLLREQRRRQSLSRFVAVDSDRGVSLDYLKQLSAGLANTAAGMMRTLPVLQPTTAADPRVSVRNPAVKGPLETGGDWLRDKAGAGAAAIAIARLPNSADITYEIANFIDGTRSVGEIRNAVSAEFEPIDVAAVAEYIDVLAKAGAVTFRK